MTHIIAVDIDGTLFTSERTISAKTRDTLAVALNHGHYLVLASGRPLAGLAKIAQTLKVDLTRVYLSASNGAQVARADTLELIVNETLERNATQALLKHLKNFDVTVMMTQGDRLICEDAQGYMVDLECRENNLRVDLRSDLANTLDFDPFKVLISAEASYLAHHHPRIAEPFLDRFAFVFSAPFYYEAIRIDVNKGTALVHLCKHLNLPLSQTIAFGDNQNDHAMLEVAGLGVAMGNARPDTQAIADEVTLDNDHDGIAHTLKQKLNFPTFKAVAVDMDGSFLAPNNDYDRPFFNAIYARLRAQGMRWIVASGNQYYQLKSFFEGLDAEIVYVAENGGLIVDQGEVLHQAVFSKRALDLVKGYCQAHAHLKAVYCGARSAYVLPDPAFYAWASIYAYRLDTVASFEDIDETILKINLIFPEAETQAHLDALNALLEGELEAVSSGPGNLDLIAKGSNKGTGLALVAQRYGFTLADILSFGDGGNDKEMLQRCGLSYAMANAPAAIKALAMYEAPSNEDQGVLRILDVYLPE